MQKLKQNKKPIKIKKTPNPQASVYQISKKEKYILSNLSI